MKHTIIPIIPIIPVAVLLSGCSGALTGGIGAIGSQIPGALNIPTSVCVATITQEMQTLGQLKATILGTPSPIAP